MPFQSCDHDHRFGSVTNYFHVGLLKLQLLPSLSPALFISIKFVKPLVLLTISETRSIQFISPSFDPGFPLRRKLPDSFLPPFQVNLL